MIFHNWKNWSHVHHVQHLYVFWHMCCNYVHAKMPLLYMDICKRLSTSYLPMFSQQNKERPFYPYLVHTINIFKLCIIIEQFGITHFIIGSIDHTFITFNICLFPGTCVASVYTRRSRRCIRLFAAKTVAHSKIQFKVYLDLINLSTHMPCHG